MTLSKIALLAGYTDETNLTSPAVERSRSRSGSFCNTDIQPSLELAFPASSGGGCVLAKTRVHELAKAYGVESKFILEQLKDCGVFAKSASSVVSLEDELRLRERLRSLQPPGRSSELNAKGASSQAMPRSEDEGLPLTPVRPTLQPATPPPVASSPRPEVPTGSPATSPTHPPPVLSEKVRTVPIHSLSSENDLRLILRECKRVSAGGRVVFDLRDAEGFYPSIAVPAVAFIQHFREAGARIEIANASVVAEIMSIRNPLEATPANLSEANEHLSRLWAYFDHQQANALTSAFMDTMRRKVECEEGVLEALEWCLYEVLDNVMQHSKSDSGYAMLQLHVRSKRLAVCIADTGIGVQRSLASSPLYRPKTAFDALTMAVREGVTRDKASNQGNGLFGLVKIVEQNMGKLQIRSGRGKMVLQNNRFTGSNDQQVIGPDHHGAILDFQLKVDKPVSLGNALNYEPVNLYLESLESEQGEHVISIRGQAGGAGSRAAARELKILIMNVLNQGVSHVALDFEGQAVVSSSFADEVIGKMFAEMGYNTFNQRIHLRNMNPTVGTLVDRAIARRLSQGAS